VLYTVVGVGGGETHTTCDTGASPPHSQRSPVTRQRLLEVVKTAGRSLQRGPLQRLLLGLWLRRLRLKWWRG
jgi:hypothetical protein